MLKAKAEKVSANHKFTQTRINPKNNIKDTYNHINAGLGALEGVAVTENMKQIRDLCEFEPRPNEELAELGIIADIMAGEDDDVLTISEAAALLRVHPVTLRKRAVAWGVPHKRLGSEWRFSRAVLTAWIQERDVA